jgi:hypothetical protein
MPPKSASIFNTSRWRKNLHEIFIGGAGLSRIAKGVVDLN